jgi:hypothetical protein
LLLLLVIGTQTPWSSASAFGGFVPKKSLLVATLGKRKTAGIKWVEATKMPLSILEGMEQPPQ